MAGQQPPGSSGSSDGAAAEGEHARRARPAPRATAARSSVAEGRLAVVDEDLGDACGPAAASIVGVGVAQRQRRAASASAGRPCVLPAPGGPTSTTRGAGRRVTTCASRLGDRGEVRRVVARGLGHRVAAELLQARPRPAPARPSPRRRPRRPGRRRRRSAGGCASAASPVATSTVSQRPRHGGDRLHRGAHPQHARRWTCRPRCRRRGRCGGGCTPSASRSISSWAAEPRRRGGAEAVADLDALDRLDAHQRRRPAGRRGGGPSARASRGPAAARRRDLDDAAEGVAVLVGRVDLGDHRGRRVGVEAAHRVGVERVDVVRRSAASASSGADAAPIATTCARPAGRRGLLEERARRPRRAPPGPRSRGREARSSTGRASSKPYFCMPTRSAWPGPRPGQRRVAGDSSASRRQRASAASTGSAAMTVSHLGHSVLPTSDGDRAAQGHPVPHAAEERRPRPARTSSARRGRSRAGGGPARRRCRRVGDLDAGGQPLEVATRAGPWDSPAVSQRSMARILPRGPQPPSSQVRIRDRPSAMRDPRPEAHRRAERDRRLRSADPAQRAAAPPRRARRRGSRPAARPTSRPARRASPSSAPMTRREPHVAAADAPAGQHGEQQVDRRP